MSDNFYSVLGLDRSATADEIKHAYRLLARKYHPDAQNPFASEDLFRQVSEAYSVLSSVDRKEIYDDSLGPITPNIEKKRNHIFEKMDAEPTKKSSEAQTPPPPIPPQPFKDSGILGRITKMLKGKRDDSVSDADERTRNIRGERIYKFSIDGLESLTGTSRELALRSQNDRPRMLKVKIPAGSCDGDHLRVNNEAENEEYLIRISITPHEFVEREGRDIILRIPITMGEALSGIDLTIPLLAGSMTAKIPPNWDVKKRIRIKGRGIIREDDVDAGDLYLVLVVISPDRNIPQVDQVAKLLDEGYSASPRSRFPKDYVRRL